MSSVSLEDVSKTYPSGITALQNVSLEIADGELLVLAGPSGCGKTTTLRLIAGLESVSSGTIRIGDRVMNRVPPAQRGVAMVFQRPAVYPHLSVRDNLAFALRMRRPIWPWRPLRTLLRGGFRQLQAEENDIAQRVVAVARLTGLGDVLDRQAVRLSGGEQQRVAFARAIVHRPAVFLLDEPLTQLDAPLRGEMRQELRDLQRRLGTTTIYVTHDQTEAMALADRLAVMDRGVIQQMDRPSVIYDHPSNRFVAGFIGWPPMNFVDGELQVTGNGLVLRAGSSSIPLPADCVRGWDSPASRNVTLGVRPDDVAIETQPRPEPGFRMEVCRVEPLGRESLVMLERDGCYLTSRVAGPVENRVGDKKSVFVRLSRPYLFDRVTGQTLAVGGLAEAN
jgi:multiple sugar transport system ATP-binding protein